VISRGLDVLDETECRVLLRRRTLGRVGLQHGGEFLILPVFYAMVDDRIVFRTAPGAKLDAAVMGTAVVFEVDQAAPPWSVLVHGRAHEIREHLEQVRARSVLGNDWPAGERERLVAVTIERISGRRIPRP
jgi:nitroimidazol reductase NimA-like FMN-containing flavoprotein (pyridoxamine 5'-phosphate oxidase superfamily)